MRDRVCCGILIDDVIVNYLSGENVMKPRLMPELEFLKYFLGTGATLQSSARHNAIGGTP